MSQIKQLLRLREQGCATKKMARILGVSKNTVKDYLNKATVLPYTTSQLLDMEDEALEHQFHAGNPAYRDERFEDFKNRLDYFSKELKRTGVNKRLLWEEYRQQNPPGGGYGYSQFCYHLSQHLKATRPSMVLDHQPGEKLFIDFAGKTLAYVDPYTGEIIECQVFVACLPYSDYGFAMAVKTQQLTDFIHALVCCLRALGGAPRVLVPDNLKAAITKASRFEPTINRSLEQLANHYGITVVPARAGKPRDKALVENHVKLIYSRVYARLRNQQFFSLGALNQAIAEKMKAHNQTRMQQKDCNRQEVFLAKEKPLLIELPQQEFELQYTRELTVAQNNHIYLSCDKHYYSVPYIHTGQKVKVIYTHSMVRIYADGQQVAIHQRSGGKGRYTTVKEHLCSHHNHYLSRSPQYYIQKAGRLSPQLKTLFEKLFEQGRYPEQVYGSCEGLLSLQRKAEAATFQQACQTALDYEYYSYNFIRNLLTNNLAGRQHQIPDKPLPPHSNIRGKNYYQ